ncbi:response regulator [Pedobacter rhizosphaerae]|uniref:Two component transcriptional regulator, LuxR family n=1 Tax=Pedobacter rhizosphaerae TaxID=390241 RepID=A0A1H9PBP2_9SPHI|nr:response regulator transcription factor [Pedobacter rhizosphaerae]SER45608.1 two component transcriptional regulator, LuxR family [Pedobacter rhizosphaerae]
MLLHKVTLAIVDDHPVVIEGLQNILKNHDRIEIVGSFINGKDFISFIENSKVDVVLLDISLPDINGIALCREIKKSSPKTSILALSNHDERSMIMKMIENGASGYLLKNTSVDELIRCIEEAVNGNITFSSAVKEIISNPGLGDFREAVRLTKREKEILSLVALGKTTQTIADELFLSKLTVETHRKHLLQKFKVKNVAELIKIASQDNLL